ncbi:hypothetical protein [Brevundimonas goettingensis]|uniref:Uncharacterized protein n=1 Tax=Brevundimonas goettingensis TaxID=2774190 RepID=A0A975C3Q3_9CAUL|nr:hypothetical protein [Brevundimonas goettingensis]QTC91305.1 hypothetical protein IFJ75_19260 [Brevundimonas goettingensis]
MGREAVTTATYDGRTDEAKVLLENQGVILRAPFSLTIPRDGISHLAVEGEALTGQGPRGPFELMLGAVEAGKWKTALEKPLPTLAEKLGLKPDVTVWTAGDVGAPELAGALEGVERAEVDEATLLIVHVANEAGLTEALAASAGSAAPVWVMHGKGKAAAFGEGQVRVLMRERGFIDTKASAVSDVLSATRYVKR